MLALLGVQQGTEITVILTVQTAIFGLIFYLLRKDSAREKENARLQEEIKAISKHESEEYQQKIECQRNDSARDKEIARMQEEIKAISKYGAGEHNKQIECDISKLKQDVAILQNERKEFQPPFPVQEIPKTPTWKSRKKPQRIRKKNNNNN